LVARHLTCVKARACGTKPRPRRSRPDLSGAAETAPSRANYARNEREVQRQNDVVLDFAPHAWCRTVAVRLMRLLERLIAFIAATLTSIDPRRL
jgi:hypothetical protein